MIRFGTIIAAIACSLTLATAVSAQARYPMVFDSVAKLKKIGIALPLPGLAEGSDAFPTRCYYYGDGGWDISISDELLAEYKTQGFSRRSACMALVSGIRFNPENGKRLATYIILDRKQFKNGKPIDDGAMSDELPLSLPRCFNRGLPYADCAWSYDPMTGKTLSAAQTQKIKTIGAQIDKFLSDPETRRKFKYLEDDSPFTKGMILVGAAQDKPADLPDDSGLSFYDESNELPKGYGYALYAEGAAGPDVSPETVKAAVDGLKAPPQVDPRNLKSIWGTGN
jgi:hypothetical protein